MKLTKLSLVALLLVGSSAFAIENTKFSGDAKLYYSTDDATHTDKNGKVIGNSLFDAGTSIGQAALGLGVTSDLKENIKGSVHLTALSTLGLENQLVGGVWEGTNGVTDSFWFDTANITGTFGNTTASAGRMTLDTPLVFTETWSIAYNTFEAAVVANTDIPDTTLIGAYVGGSNGGDGSGSVIGAMQGSVDVNTTTGSGTSGSASNFSQFYNGAYAVGAINNSWKPLAVQAWYYGATSVLSAYWVQADLDISGILVGAQYTGGKLSAGNATIDGSYSAMVGYSMKDTFTAKLAYAQTGKKNATVANLSGSGQSKLYTEAWWNYGVISQSDTSSINLTLEAPIADVVDLGLYATNVDAKNKTDKDMTEVTLSASKSFGELDTSLVYIYADLNDNDDTTAKVDASNTLQVYLTYNY